MQVVRGAEIAMVFQDPMTSLNPVHTVGWQIAEQIRAHRKVGRHEARSRSIELLQAVGIPRPEQRFDQHPHEFSGGMRQRVMIAMALSCEPALLIADEPTTALDVTIQAQILELIRDLRKESGSAVVLITHDVGVVADIADRVIVMYAGRAVEVATKEELFDAPQHPYTWGLMASVPRLDLPKPHRLPAIPGQPPSLISLPDACSFASRCPHRFEACLHGRPPLVSHATPGHFDACLLPAGDRERLRAQQTTGSAA
jgi:peptide/nickel transport system ATP-binding protein